MPELGKATYDLIFRTGQFDAGMANAEARATAATNAIGKKMGVAEERIAAVGTQAEATAAAFSGATSTIEGDAAAQAGAVTKSSEEMIASQEKVAAGSKVAGAGFMASWSKAGKSIGGIGKSIEHTGMGLTRHLTAPIVGVALVGAKMALNFGQSLKMIQTQAGGTAKEVSYMHDQVLKFAASGQSISGPKALADALFHIESAGIRGANAMKVLKVAQMGAMTGGADLEDTTYALLGVMESGVKGAKNLGQAMGAMNAIVGSGDMRMTDLVGAFRTGIIPMAKAVGISINDIGAALDVFTVRGVPAEEAATRLKMSLALMERPTTAATKALATLNLSHDTLARVLHGPGGLPAAVLLLRQRVLALHDPVKGAQTLLAAFGGGKTGSGMLTLVQNADDLRKRWMAVHESAKNFKKDAEAAANLPINKMKASWVQMQAALVKIGEIAIPILTKVAQAFARLAAWFGHLSPEWKKIILIALAFAAAIGPVLTVIGTLVKVFGMLFNVIKAGIFIVQAFDAVMLANPIGLVIAAIAALIIIFIVLYKKVKWFHDSVIYLMHHWWIILLFPVAPVIAIFMLLYGRVKVVRDMMLMLWRAFSILVIQPFKWLAGIIIGYWTMVWNFVRGFVSWLILAFTNPIQAIKNLWADFSRWFGELVSGIKNVASKIWSGIVGIFTSPISTIEHAWSGVSGFFGSVWSGIVGGSAVAAQDVSANMQAAANSAAAAAASVAAVNQAIVGGVLNQGIKDQGQVIYRGGKWRDPVTGKPVANQQAAMNAWRAKHHVSVVQIGPGSHPISGSRETAPETPAQARAKSQAAAIRAQDAALNAAIKAQEAAIKGNVAGAGGGSNAGVGAGTTKKKTKKKGHKETAAQKRAALALAEFGVPWEKLQIQYDKALNTKSLSDDEKVLNEEETFLTKLLKKRGLSLKVQLAAERALNGVDKALLAVHKKIQMEAIKKIQDEITIAQAKADLANNPNSQKAAALRKKLVAAEVKLMNEEESDLRKQIKNAKGNLDLEASLYKQLAAIDKKKLALLKESTAAKLANAKEMLALLELRGSFFSEFAGNIFGGSAGNLSLTPNTTGNTAGGNTTTVNVNQHNTYSKPSPNRHAEADAMRRATAAAHAFIGW